MAVLLFEGCERDRDLSSWQKGYNYATFVTNTPFTTTNSGRPAPWCMEVTSNTAKNTWEFGPFNANSRTKLYFGFAVNLNFETTGTKQEQPWMEILDVNGTERVRVYLHHQTTTGPEGVGEYYGFRAVLLSTSAEIFDTGPVIKRNGGAWHYVEIHFDFLASGGACEVRVDEATIAAATKTNIAAWGGTGTLPTGIRWHVGPAPRPASTIGIIRWDDHYITDDVDDSAQTDPDTPFGFLGDVFVENVVPIEDVSVPSTDWQAQFGAGETSQYQTIDDDGIFDGSNYIYTDQANRRAQFKFAAPSVALDKVLALSYDIDARLASSGTRVIQPFWGPVGPSTEVQITVNSTAWKRYRAIVGWLVGGEGQLPPHLQTAFGPTRDIFGYATV